MAEIAASLRTRSARPARIHLRHALVYTVLSLGSIAMVFPFVWMVASAFKNATQINAIPPVWLPNPITLVNFRSVWGDLDLLRLFANSLFLSSLITMIALYTSTVVGYALAKYRFPGRDAFFLAIIATMMIPWPATLVPIYQVCLKAGLLNNWGGVVVPSLFSTFGIFMMRQFMHSIPNDMCDAAHIDGCSDWGTFHRIVLPNCRSGLGALGIFTFMWHWDNFLWPLIVLTDEKLYTLPIGIAYYVGQYFTNIGPVLAAATLAVAPVLVAFLAFQSQIVQSMTLTGLKG